ncbi:MAG: cytochrome c oxidase subunit II, partial [Deltaproteobacteria bacterium]
MWGLPLFPPQASTLAPQVDALFFFMLGVSAFFSLLIAGLIVYFAIKYHRRSEDEETEQVHEPMALELTWTMVPLALTMVMYAWGASVFFTAVRPPRDALEVYVVGKQWMWKFQHAEGQREIDELHMPLGRPVRLTMTSEDVIHS